jgi:hypothetical protein
MSSTRELTAEHVNAILPRWYVRFLILPADDPSKSAYEMWIEDVMINIFSHETIDSGIGSAAAALRDGLVEIADILLD